MALLGVSKADLTGDKRTAYPHYTAEGNDLCSGSNVLASIDDDVERLVALVMAFSVLHLRFPKKLGAFLTHVQLYMMGIDEGGCVPQRALKIRRQLA